MVEQTSLPGVYVPSENIVAREIEGEIIIVPLVSGIGDLEDELYTLNEYARAIWEKLDGSRDLSAVVRELTDEYDAPEGKIETDVRGIVGEWLRRKMLVPVASD